MISPLRFLLPGRVTTAGQATGVEGSDPFVLPLPGREPATGNILPGSATPEGPRDADGIPVDGAPIEETALRNATVVPQAPTSSTQPMDARPSCIAVRQAERVPVRSCAIKEAAGDPAPASMSPADRIDGADTSLDDRTPTTTVDEGVDDPLLPATAAPTVLFGTATALLLGGANTDRNPQSVEMAREPSPQGFGRTEPLIDRTISTGEAAAMAPRTTPVESVIAIPATSMPPTLQVPPVVAGALHPLDAAKLEALTTRSERSEAAVQPGGSPVVPATSTNGPRSTPQPPEVIAEPSAAPVATASSIGARPDPRRSPMVTGQGNAITPTAPSIDGAPTTIDAVTTRHPVASASEALVKPIVAAPRPLSTGVPSPDEREAAPTQRTGAAGSSPAMPHADAPAPTLATAASTALPEFANASAPVVEAGGNGAAGSDAPPPSPDRQATDPLIERVEFDTGADGVTRLRLVHESVGRLLVTLDAGDRTDVRLTSDDAAVRQTLADALPTLRRLADDRHLPLGALEVTASRIGADTRGRDAPADRRPAPQPAHITTSTPRAVPRSTPSAGRSAGLFA